MSKGKELIDYVEATVPRDNSGPFDKITALL